MRTKLLLTSSALFLGILGLAATFLPQEILAALGSSAVRGEVLAVQALGAAYLGLAILNWMNRGNLLGGIYNRPAAMGNFLHFAMVALALLNALAAGERHGLAIAGAVLYSLFAAGFGHALFTNPLKSDPPQESSGES